MATYTITIQELLQMNYPLNLNNYPIFNESHRNELNKKFLAHFMFREIGAETPDRFNFFLGRKLNEIMPYYNELYRSTCFQYDPLSSEYFKYMESEKTLGTEQSEKEGLEKLKNFTENYFANISRNNSNITEDEKNNTSKSGNENGNDTQTRTDNLKETVEDTNKINTDTDNVTDTTQKNDDTSHGHNLTNGYKSSVFADVPQSPFKMQTTVDPDGTVHTDIEGYATTVNRDSTYENNTTDTETQGNANTKSVGNTSTIQSSNENKIKDNTGTQTIENEKTKNFSEDNNSSINKNSNEEGVTKNDGQETNLNSGEQFNAGTEKRDKKENKEKTFTFKGRKGYSPSTLIKEFRDNIINIDLMIIEELEILFMGVF